MWKVVQKLAITILQTQKCSQLSYILWCGCLNQSLYFAGFGMQTFGIDEMIPILNQLLKESILSEFELKDKLL